ncbi:MAG: hypothetical protein CL681_28380 [Blastopirellula sp.]|nr:hypothetical protein [Blastopirellula sp.]MAR13878.1 hypothetical protein [Blastopirellula sp.]
MGIISAFPQRNVVGSPGWALAHLFLRLGMSQTCQSCGAPVGSEALERCPYCGAALVVIAEPVVVPAESSSGDARMIAIRQELETLRQAWEADAQRLMVRDAAGNWMPPPEERDGFKFVIPFGVLGMLCFMAFPLLGSRFESGKFAGAGIGFILFFVFPLIGVGIDGYFDRIAKAKFRGYQRRKQQYDRDRERLLDQL